MSEANVRHIKECTLCGACKDSCPNGVDTVGVFVAARAGIVKKQDAVCRVNDIEGAFRSLRVKGTAIKIAGALQGLFLKDASVRQGLFLRFSLPASEAETFHRLQNRPPLR